MSELPSEPAPVVPAPRKRRDYTRDGLGGAILALSAPMAADQIISSLYRIADLYFIGRLGPTAVAATSLGSMATFSVLSIGFGIAVAGLAVVARRIGEGDPEGAAHSLWQVLLLGTAASLVVGLLGALVARPLVSLLGAEGEVLELATDYVGVSFLLLAPAVLSLAVNRALRGAGEPGTALWTMAIGSVLSVVLSPVLILGLGPVRGLGVVGSAVAAAAGQTASFLLAMAALASGRLRLVASLRTARPDLPLIGRMLKVALPVAGQLLLRSTSRLVLAPLIASFGPGALAAYGIMVRVMMFPLSIGFGLGNAAGTLVGQNLGAGRPGRAARAAWIIAASNVGLMAIAAAVLVALAPAVVAHLVEDGPSVVDEGATIFYVVAPSYVFAALGVVMGRALDGAGDTVPAMWVNLVTLWVVQVPLAYALALGLGLGTTGVWIGIAASNVLNGTVFGLWFLRGSWKRKVL